MSTSRTEPAPELLRVQERLRAKLADGPLPCSRVSPENRRDQGLQAHARRRLGVQTVRIDGVPHYRLPEEPSS